MIKRTVAALALLLLIAGAIFFSRSDLNRIYLPTATGLTAKQVCSLHFVSGFTHERARALYINPLGGDFARLIRSRVDRPDREVRANILGLYRQRAVYREGVGCSLVHDGRDFDRELALPPAREHQPLPLDADHRDAHFDTPALHAALEANFAEPEGGGRNTLAIVVLHEGRLVAERYADGVTPGTPLHGWSMAKSLTATLAGAMVKRGEIDLAEPGVVNAPGREDITLEHLLNMTAGLDMTETGDGWDPNSEMLFTRSDMAEWAAGRERLHPPGEHWSYMSGNTILAMRAMQDRLGETLERQLAGVRERVFEPLGMYSTILETDEAGTLQGSSYMYASAHDWARLGQLYLDGGMVGETRVLPADWNEVVTEPAPGSGGGYGLGFWLGRPFADALADFYYMSGFQAQFGFIYPTQDLVMVRFGASNFANPGTFTLAADIAAALLPEPDTGDAGEPRGREASPETYPPAESSEQIR